MNIYNVITVISAILLLVFILIQNRGASLGAAFGGSGEIHRSRRGVEKIVFQISIILALIFVLSVVLGLLSNAR